MSGLCFEIRARLSKDRFATDIVIIWGLWVAVRGGLLRDIGVMPCEVVRVLRTGGGSGFDVDMTRAAT